MKKYIVLFSIFLGVFIVPSNVFAEEQTLYVPYYNKIEDFDVESGEGETLKNILYENSSVVKEDGDKCILFYYNYGFGQYQLSCSPDLSKIFINYESSKNRFTFTIGYRTYTFNTDYLLKNSYSSFFVATTLNSFENLILYSDVPIVFSKNNIYQNVSFYDINDSSKIYGNFLLDGTTSYDYKDFYLTEPKEEIVIFDDNDFHSISKLILGDNIPEEYSFIYTISDYLLVILLVIIVLSPIAIIVKVMRW